MSNNIGKQLILDALSHKPVSRTPWIPFAGVHSASLKGYSAEEFLKDADKLVECLMEVNRFYAPDGQPVIFDLQIEAEILGCELVWDKKAPPSVKTHPLENTQSIPTLIPTGNDGRLPVVLKAMNMMKSKVGEKTALFGLVCGPFTLASHLRGTNLFMDMLDDEAYVNNLLDYCTKVCLAITDLYIKAGMDVIAYVDPMVSQISPAHFQQFLAKPFTTLFQHTRSQNIRNSLFVCGDATKNIDVMCHTLPDSIFVDENINLVQAKVITDAHNVTLGGNIPLTTVMLLGTQQDNMKYALELIEKMGTKNFILSPGCDMPFDVPKENVVGIVQAVQDGAATKKLIENYKAPEMNIDIELPDYKHLKKPLIELFTLDSATCAACGYMKAAVDEAAAHFGTKVDAVEYKFTVKENVARCVKMGVQHLPVLYINGELKYSSLIPSRKELFELIQTYL